MAERDLKNRESKKRKNALLLKRARDAALRRSAELIHDSRPNPKKRMHAGRFPSRSLPILEPSQGVNTTAFTTYSRDYFPPRGKRLSVQLAFRAVSFDVCSCSRRFMAFTQAARLFGPCTPRHTATLHFRVRRRAERSRRGRPTDSRKPPNIAKDALLSLHGSSTSGQLQSNERSYFLPDKRDRFSPRNDRRSKKAKNV